MRSFLALVCDWQALTIIQMPIKYTGQGSHGMEKPGKSRGFVIVFFPGLEIGNFLENREIS